MHLIPVKTKVFKSGQNIFDFFLNSSKRIKIDNGDIIVIASKLLSYQQKRIYPLKNIRPTAKTRQMAKKYSLDPAFCQLVINEADKIYGGVKKAILTLKNGYVVANAGIDQSNVKKGSVALWPLNMNTELDRLRKALQRHYKAKIGLILADSHCSPLRLGTRGLAVAISGFEGIIDERTKKDIFGRSMKITRINTADNLASAALSLMGESNQKTPFVIIKGAKIKMTSKKSHILTKLLKIDSQSCLFRDYKLK